MPVNILTSYIRSFDLLSKPGEIWLEITLDCK
jgi:hypothetical protein